MTDYVSALFSLILAHLLGDFVFQTERIAEAKAAARASAYAWHGITHLSLTMLCIALFTDFPLSSPMVLSIVLAAVVSHTLIDVVKSFSTRKGWIADGLIPFVVDQSLHLLTLAFLALGLVPRGAGLSAILTWWRSVAPRVLLISVVYGLVVFAGGHLIRILLIPMSDRIYEDSKASAEQLRNAGMYIGWLERTLIVTALAAKTPATAGLIVAAKSIFRFPELKGRPFAEYFLIGTLLSVLLAVLGGLALVWLLQVLA